MAVTDFWEFLGLRGFKKIKQQTSRSKGGGILYVMCNNVRGVLKS